MSPEESVKAYLALNRGSLERAPSIDAVVRQVQSNVFPVLSPLSEDQIRKIVRDWAMVWAAGLLIKIPTGGPGGGGAAGSGGPPAPSSNELVDSVKKVITTIGAGVTIGKEGANFNLKVTGLTANLKTADGSVSLSASWGGTMKLDAEHGPLHFSGTIASDKWEISLSFPQDDYVPSLDTLPAIFKDGEGAFRNIARAASGLKNLDDIRKISGLIKPDVDKVQSAVDAAAGVASAPKKGGMTFGFKIGSPDRMPGQQGIPGGVQGMAVLTWVF